MISRTSNPAATKAFTASGKSIKGRSRRLAVDTKAAFISASPDGLKLTLDFYSLLKVTQAATKDGITRSYEKSIEENPVVEYSSRAWENRATILRSSYETLINVRREYDERLSLAGDQQGIAEEVPMDFAPGVLILLHEIGDYETVIAAGNAWLTANKRHAQSKDVAAVVALCHCEEARALLADGTEDKGIAQKAEAKLRDAREVLKRHRAAPRLQSQITEGLAELAPRLAFELLSLPLEDTEQRAKGLKLLPEVLSGYAAPPSVGSRPSAFRTKFLERLRGVLTPQEQSQLLDTCGQNFACSPTEAYGTALALIAEGCVSFKPAQLARAAELLSKAEEEATQAESLAAEGEAPLLTIRRAAEERNRRAVALAVCQLLLGNTDAATSALGLDDTRPKCDRQVLAFIKANSADRNDMLPGLCVLTQRWVQDVVFTSFRGIDTAKIPSFTLDTWYGSDQVNRYLASASAGEASKSAAVAALGLVKNVVTLPFIAAAGLVGRIFTQPAQQQEGESSEGQVMTEFSSGKEVYEQTQRKSVPKPQPEVVYSFQDAEAASSSDSSGVTVKVGPPPPEPKPAAVAESVTKPAPVAPSKPAPPTASSSYRRSSPPPKAPKAPELPKKEKSAAAGMVFAGGDINASNPFLKGLSAGTFKLNDGDESDGQMTNPMSLSEIQPLGGEDDWMRTAYEARTINWQRVIIFAALSVAAGVAAARPNLPASLKLPFSRTSSNNAATSSSQVVLSKKEATGVVKKWQKIKAAALGPKHSINELSTVLRGKLLKEWTDKASSTAAKGWYYKHNLVSCDVLSVTDNGANKATVKAAFVEQVTAYKSSVASEKPQTFTSDYVVEYSMVKEGNGWVLTSSKIKN